MPQVYRFYAHIKQTVYLDNKLTMNEAQFTKLAHETGITGTALDEDTSDLFM